MSVAARYLDVFKTTCVFHTDEKEEKSFAGLLQVQVNTVCGQPAVAVYVSDDEDPRGQYVCQTHAEFAEANGDGPVFWQRAVVNKWNQVVTGPSVREELIAEATKQGLNVAHLSPKESGK